MSDLTPVSFSDHGRGRDKLVELRAWIEHIRADVKAGLTPYDSSFVDALWLVVALERDLEGAKAEKAKPDTAMVSELGLRALSEDVQLRMKREARNHSNLWANGDKPLYHAALALQVRTHLAALAPAAISEVRKTVFDLFEAGELSAWMDQAEHVDAFLKINAALQGSSS